MFIESVRPPETGLLTEEVFEDRGVPQVGSVVRSVSRPDSSNAWTICSNAGSVDPRPGTDPAQPAVRSARQSASTGTTRLGVDMEGSRSTCSRRAESVFRSGRPEWGEGLLVVLVGRPAGVGRERRERDLRLVAALHVLDRHGVVREVLLADEVLTPDSSRYWPADRWQPGSSPPSFDKQFVRDFASGTGWDRTPPAPQLPQDIVSRTREKYVEAYERITGREDPDRKNIRGRL